MLAVRVPLVLAAALLFNSTALPQAKPKAAPPPVEAHKEAAVDGHVSVRVRAAKVGEVSAYDLFKDLKTFKGEDLQILLRIDNASETRKVDYFGWGSRPRMGTGVRVTDNLGNRYRMIDYGVRSRPRMTVTRDELPDLEEDRYVLQVQDESIHPGKNHLDALFFEKPIAAAEHLIVELPAENYGGKGTLRLKMLKAMWDGTVAWERREAKRKAAVEAAQREETAKRAEEERRKQEAAEQAKLREEREKAEAPAKAEKAATAALTLIKQSLDAGKLEGAAARARLERFIKQYPDTKAAVEAKGLLKKL